MPFSFPRAYLSGFAIACIIRTGSEIKISLSQFASPHTVIDALAFASDFLETTLSVLALPIATQMVEQHTRMLPIVATIVRNFFIILDSSFN